jgi:two-component system sensor histidine kinase RegB
MISTERDFGRGILNLLNNAADASPDSVEVNCSSSSRDLRIWIEDRGPGIPSELENMAGETPFTTKGDKGTGIGLLLARVAVARAGGKLNLSGRPGGGTRAEVVLPLEEPTDADRASDHGPEKSAAARPELSAHAAVPVHGWKR